MFKFKPTLALLALVSIGIAACSNDEAGEMPGLAAGDDLLAYIPADAPYVLAATGKLPDDVYEKLAPQIDATLKLYPALIKGFLHASNAAEEGGMSDDELETALGFVDEFASVMSIDGLATIGIDRDSAFAVYGAGMLPVFRLTLSDGSLMENMLARLETSAGDAMPVDRIGDVEFRYLADEEMRIILAVIGDELVAAVVPATLSEDNLSATLGLTPPDRNIAQAGTLREIGDKYNYVNYMSGFIDVERLAAIFLDEPSGINAEILGMVDYEAAFISDVCKAEARSLAAIMPRLVVGYTELSTKAITQSAAAEIRSDLAADMSALTGPVPGLGADHGGIFSFGMSANLLAAREFYSARLDALENDPYECPELGQMQAGVVAGREILAQPVPPIVYGFNGFLAVVDDIQGLDIATQQPPTSIDARLLLSMDNAEGLIAMGTMFSPELAALNIEPNGEPVKLEMGQLAALGQTVHLAMTDSAIALSFGDGTEAGLGSMLNAPVANPSPVMTFDMDAARYYGFIGDVMMADVQMDVPGESRAAMQALADSVGDAISRMSMDVQFTNNGIEMNSTMTLAD